MHKTEFSFGEMNVESRKFAASLLAMGVRPGEKVAVWGPNQPEWLLMVSTWIGIGKDLHSAKFRNGPVRKPELPW